MVKNIIAILAALTLFSGCLTATALIQCPPQDVMAITVCPNCGKAHVVSIIPQGALDAENEDTYWKPFDPEIQTLKQNIGDIK